jgi:hypothetical protein
MWTVNGGPADMLAAIRAWTSSVDTTVANASPTTVEAFAAFDEDFLSQPSPEDASVGEQDLAESLAAAHTQAVEAASTAAEAITPGLQTARAKMIDALSSVAPEAALHLSQSSEEARQINDSDPNRFAWLLAATGRGSGAALSDWNYYAEVCELWLGEFTASSLVQSVSNGDLTGIEPMAPLLRLGPSSTRLRWISDLLCEAIGEWADNSGNDALRPFSSSSMQGLNASVTWLLDHHGVADESTFFGIDAQLLSWLTAERTPTGPPDFEKRFLSTDPDTHPLVTIGGTLQALNAGAWYLTREIAVLAALRDHVNSHEQGRAYEEALVTLFKAVGPPDLTASSDRRIGRPGTTGKRKSHEVDLLISGDDLLVVGEAKAHIPASQGSGVSSSYENQLLKSIRQVKDRLDALASGQVVLGSPHTPVDVSHRLGLCVPLHDYAGTAWRGDTLARFYTSNPCVVMPAHGFALAMSCLRDQGEVSAYLRMRLSLSNGLFVGHDELELLLGWLERGYFEMTAPANSVPTFVHPRPYQLDPRVALYHPRPQDRNLWIEEVYATSHPIDLVEGSRVVVDVGEVLHRLSLQIIEWVENGGIINLTRVAGPQVWDHLLSIPPLRSAAVDTTVDTVAQVLRAHDVSAASIQTLSTDATDRLRSESIARILLVHALEPTPAKRHWWKPSTWRHFMRRLGHALVARSEPAEVRDLIFALISLGRQAMHQRRN